MRSSMRSPNRRDRDSARLVSRSLSGYLCGTHSGALRSRRGDHLTPYALAQAHRALEPSVEGVEVHLGGERWRPDGRAARLAERLPPLLDDDSIVELVLFGSQARGGTTGFSDVDAILVITDQAAEDPRLLRSLRPPALAAQREVLAYQPMQHHGFEVATPSLLRLAGDALALPRVALSETCSLGGESVVARFTVADSAAERDRLRELASVLLGIDSWPSHPWHAHRLISMFELLPAVYLQARGQHVPKWRSFERAEDDFGDAWWPYEVLREVRSGWPHIQSAGLRAATATLRNPWLAVAAWRRLPASPAKPVSRLLTANCLHGLQSLGHRMLESIS